MTVCNMSIEGGARAGMVAPDEKTFAYHQGPAEGAQGRAPGTWRCATGRRCTSDDGAHFDRRGQARRRQAAADRHLGHQPGGRGLHRPASCPIPAKVENENKRASMRRALDYMGLTPGTKMTDIPLDVVWIGSCTNGRIEDLRDVAKVVKGKKVIERLAYAMIVPGSGLVKEQAEAEGLDKIFKDAGFEWREAGCSMCLGMNPDQLKPQQRCASTSNRNFEGRQGRLGPHALRVARHGGSGGHRGPLRRHPELGRLALGVDPAGPTRACCPLARRRRGRRRSPSAPYRPAAAGRVAGADTSLARARNVKEPSNDAAFDAAGAAAFNAAFEFTCGRHRSSPQSRSVSYLGVAFP